MNQSNNFNYLFEGLRAGDLTDLVLPLVSIDEFQSKIDDEAIVVGFYVTDNDGAEDLNRFIQRSPVDLLDSEISPAPDQNGHFMVFVEMLNDSKTVANIVTLVEEISSLCCVEEWQMQLRGVDDITELSKDALLTALKANREYDKRHSKGSDLKESTLSALGSSDLDDAVIVQHDGCARLTIYGKLNSLSYNLVASGNVDLLSQPYLNEGIDLTEAGLSRASEASRLLGSNWNVTPLVESTTMIWRCLETDQCVVVS